MIVILAVCSVRGFTTEMAKPIFLALCMVCNSIGTYLDAETQSKIAASNAHYINRWRACDVL